MLNIASKLRFLQPKCESVYLKAHVKGETQNKPKYISTRGRGVGGLGFGSWFNLAVTPIADALKQRSGIVSAWWDLQLGATSAPAPLLPPTCSSGGLSAWRWWAANANSSHCSREFYDTTFKRGSGWFCRAVTAHVAIDKLKAIKKR